MHFWLIHYFWPEYPFRTVMAYFYRAMHMSACGVRPSVCHVRELLTSRASVFITSQDAAAQLLSVTYFTASPGLIRYQVDESCRYRHVKYGILQVPSCHREAARCLVTYRHWSVSLWRDPDDVPHCRILSPDKLNEWRLISATHTADEDDVSWLSSYGSWHAYEKISFSSILHRSHVPLQI